MAEIHRRHVCLVAPWQLFNYVIPNKAGSELIKRVNIEQVLKFAVRRRTRSFIVENEAQKASLRFQSIEFSVHSNSN